MQSVIWKIHGNMVFFFQIYCIFLFNTIKSIAAPLIAAPAPQVYAGPAVAAIKSYAAPARKYSCYDTEIL